jgi:hypothetical protein
LPQNQWEQLAWQGVRKRSWQTEQTSSFGGAADADEEELMPSPLAETRVAHGPPSRPPFSSSSRRRQRRIVRFEAPRKRSLLSSDQSNRLSEY